MKTNAISLAAIALALGGCTVSAITSVHETFPNERFMALKCQIYSSGEFNDIARGMAKKQADGWRVKLTGYDHSFWFGIHQVKIWVCYEKSPAGPKPTSGSGSAGSSSSTPPKPAAAAPASP